MFNLPKEWITKPPPKPTTTTPKGEQGGPKSANPKGATAPKEG